MARRLDSAGHVALVHDWLNGMRGGEKVFEVLCELFPDATVFTLFYEPERVSPTLRSMKVVESSLARLPGARNHYRTLLPLFPRAVQRFPTPDFDLVISTSHCVAKGARPPRRGPHICYCFTPMRYVWDQFDQYFPADGGWDEWTRRLRARDWPGLRNSLTRRSRRLVMTALRPRLQAWDRRTADRVDAFLADSRHVARRIARCYRRRSRVVYPPVDCDFFTPPDPERKPGRRASERDTNEPAPLSPEARPYLVVSALVPYKRIDRAILAANQLNKPLTIIGSGPERRRLESLAGPTVQFLGWVDDQTLREAYRAARALLYPGEEDFGITALEAQACGCPVIALARGGALETVAGGKTGVFFDEPTPQALAQAIQHFESITLDPAACRSNAEPFRRARFRDSLAQAIESVLKNRL